MENTVQIANDTIDILRVFYFSYPRFNWLSKATRDYHRCFGVPCDTNHLSLQFGSKVYEVSLDGTECFDFSDDYLLHPHLVTFFECDISHISQELKLAARFALDYDVLTNRKLKPIECFRYLKHWLTRDNQMPAFSYNLDFSIPTATIQKRKFNLPYTCASQVAHVFNRIFGLEPVADNHLPSTILWTTFAMQESNLGFFYQHD